MSIFSLVVFLHFHPGRSQIAGKPAAEKNIEVLVPARVRMFGANAPFDTLKMFAVASSIAAEHNRDAAVVIARTPEPVALMIADRFRQTETRPEEIDRAGFAIIIREDRGSLLFFGRERFVNTRGG